MEENSIISPRHVPERVWKEKAVLLGSHETNHDIILMAPFGKREENEKLA